jgi:peptidoglycan/LPS O-acetylase OafA/YrhL
MWVQTDATLVLLFGLIIFGGTRADGAYRVLTFPAFILIGEASYSMYILHEPIAL